MMGCTMLFIVILVGIIIGMISSILGVGGGFITVPALLEVFKNIPHQFAVGTSLGMISINALINNIRFFRQERRPNLKLIPFMIFAVLIGAIIGSKLGNNISPKIFNIIFIGTLCITLINTVLKKQGDSEDRFELKLTTLKIIIATLFALLAGIFSGITGLGGGVVLMPIFMMVLKLPFTWIPVYNNAIILFGTLSGTITHLTSNGGTYHYSIGLLNNLQIGNVNFGIMAILLAGSFFSTKWGANIGPKIPHKLSKALFAGILLLTIIKMSLFS